MEKEELKIIYDRTFEYVFRVCMIYLKNRSDAEDIVQNTYLKALQRTSKFEDEEHEKAWLLRVAINMCKNHLKYWWRRNEPLEAADSFSTPETSELKELILGLSEKERLVIYMHYYEGYKTEEISEISGIKPSTVRSLLKRGREHLKIAIESERGESNE